MLRAVPSFAPAPAELGLLEAVPPGRIVEVSGRARASLGAFILSEVQARGEVVAWVAPRSAGLFPPDLAGAGLDLEGLLFVHLPEDDARAGPKAVELLVRTGAVGAVVLDASARASFAGPTAWQGRLSGVLREHDARLVVLSSAEGERESLGPLVSIRLALRARRVVEPETGRTHFSIETRVTKDKSGLLAGRTPHLRLFRAPRGA